MEFILGNICISTGKIILKKNAEVYPAAVKPAVLKKIAFFVFNIDIISASI